MANPMIRLQGKRASTWTRTENNVVGATTLTGKRTIPANTDLNTIYVAKAGNDGAAGTSAAPKLTITAAIAAAVADPAFVNIAIKDSGTYVESFNLQGRSLFSLDGFAPTLSPATGYVMLGDTAASNTADKGCVAVLVGANLVVAYISNADALISKYTVTATAAWSNTSTGGASVGAGAYDRIAITVDSSSRVVIAARTTAGAIRVFRMTGAPGAGTWADLGTPVASGAGGPVSVGFDSFGHPRVSSYGGSTWWLKSGTTWTQMTAAQIVSMVTSRSIANTASRSWVVSPSRAIATVAAAGGGYMIMGSYNYRAADAADVAVSACGVTVGGVSKLAVIVAQATRLIGYYIEQTGAVEYLGEIAAAPNTTGNFPIAPITGGFSAAWVNAADRKIATAAYVGVWGAVEFGEVVAAGAGALANIGNAGTRLAITESTTTYTRAQGPSATVHVTISSASVLNGINFISPNDKWLTSGGGPAIEHCTVSGYGPLVVQSSPANYAYYFKNSVFSGFSQSINILGGANTVFEISNNIFTTQSIGIQTLSDGGFLYFLNSTFSGTRLSISESGGYPNLLPLEVDEGGTGNCIFSNSELSYYDITQAGGGYFVPRYSLFSGTTPFLAGTGNISGPAAFVGNGDYSLRDRARGYYADSPAVGSGSGGADMGAYSVTRVETVAAAAIDYSFPQDVLDISMSLKPANYDSGEGPEGDFSEAFSNTEPLRRRIQVEWPAEQAGDEHRERAEYLLHIYNQQNVVFSFGLSTSGTNWIPFETFTKTGAAIVSDVLTVTAARDVGPDAYAGWWVRIKTATTENWYRVVTHPAGTKAAPLALTLEDAPNVASISEDPTLDYLCCIVDKGSSFDLAYRAGLVDHDGSGWIGTGHRLVLREVKRWR